MKVGAEPVTDYSCTENRADRLAIAFLAPRTLDQTASSQVFEQEARTLVDSKPWQEQWAVVRYSDRSASAPVAVPLRLFGQTLGGQPSVYTATPIVFMNSLAHLKEEWASHKEKDTNLPTLEATLRTLGEGVFPKAGARQVIVLADDAADLSEANMEELTSLALSAQLRIHAVCLGDNTPLEELCRSTTGIFRKVTGVSQIHPQLDALYTALNRLLVVDFKWPVQGLKLKSQIVVQVHTDSEFGEASFEA